MKKEKLQWQDKLLIGFSLFLGIPTLVFVSLALYGIFKALF